MEIARRRFKVLVVAVWSTVTFATVVAADAQEVPSARPVGQANLSRAVAPTFLLAAEPRHQTRGDWAAVTLLKAGTEVKVTLDDQSVVHGKLWGADVASLVLRVDGVDRQLARGRLESVTARGINRGRAAKKWAFVGALAGLGAAFAGCRGNGECVQKWGLRAPLIGLAGGAIVGASWPRWTDVYSR